MIDQYEIQGLRNDRWTTLFAPFPTILDVAARTNELQKANPACRYRWRKIETNEDIMNHALAYYTADREQMIADDLLSQAQARRAAREATRDPVTKRLP